MAFCDRKYRQLKKNTTYRYVCIGNTKQNFIIDIIYRDLKLATTLT